MVPFHDYLQMSFKNIIFLSLKEIFEVFPTQNILYCVTCPSAAKESLLEYWLIIKYTDNLMVFKVSR